MPNVTSGFIVGPGYDVPAGQSLLVLQINTWDRQNLGATFTITATGYSETAIADASGRATKLVPSGATYTVTLTHGGSYLGDDAQTVVANAEEIEWVTFVLTKPAIEVHENVTASTWNSDNTYQDFPYKCAIAITGVLASDVAWVTFGVEEATGPDYAPICETYAGGVYIWSSKTDSITIPNITIFRTA